MFVAVTPQKSTIVRERRAPWALRLAFGLGTWLAPGAVLARALDLFSAPSPAARRHARGVDAAASGGEHLAIHEDGRELAVYRWGDPESGPYVLIAHGWSDHALRFDALVAALTRAGYAVVAFDQPGHGRSSGATATLPEFAECIRIVGRRFGRAAAIVGHSMGGAAAAIALRDGLAADAAVLIAPPADLGAAALRFLRFVGVGVHLSARFLAALEDRASVRLADLEAHRHVPSIARRALIVHDIGDREVPWSEGERYARYWPDARIVSTDGLGHRRLLADPGVIDSVLRFLDGEAIGERVVSTRELPYGMA